MTETLDSNFRRVVEQIFNNWTALQLAVENEMGGQSSAQTATDIMNWVYSYCLAQNEPNVSDLTETLEDILDEEFSTICEDGSPKEVAQLLVKFLTYLREGNLNQFELDFSKLPVCKIWLSKGLESAPKPPGQVVEESSDSSGDEQQMDVDPEWTVVQRKKK